MKVNVKENIFGVSDGRVSPLELVNHVARLVSSTEHTAAFQALLRDDEIDRLALSYVH